MDRTLVIDDLRIFRDIPDAVYARTSDEGIDLLISGAWDRVFLDHDLGGEDTIMPVLHAIEEAIHHGYPPAVGCFVIHTSNPVGARTLEQVLSRRYPTVRVDAASFDVTTADL